MRVCPLNDGSRRRYPVVQCLFMMENWQKFVLCLYTLSILWFPSKFFFCLWLKLQFCRLKCFWQLLKRTAREFIRHIFFYFFSMHACFTNFLFFPLDSGLSKWVLDLGQTSKPWFTVVWTKIKSIWCSRLDFLFHQLTQQQEDINQQLQEVQPEIECAVWEASPYLHFLKV